MLDVLQLGKRRPYAADQNAATMTVVIAEWRDHQLSDRTYALSDRYVVSFAVY